MGTEKNTGSVAEFFKFNAQNTDWRTETTGGITTFVTMAYIVAVNPGILSDALGKDLFPELLFATCASAAIATILMGLLANYPFALAPGMGLNAFFTYTIVLGMGVHWKLALGVVLASGLLFLLLTVLRVREAIITAVPQPLKLAAAAGIGLFIAFIGFKNAGFIVDDQATLVSLGNVRTGPVGLALVGLFGTAIMLARGIRGAILLGVIGVTLLSMITELTPWPTGITSLPVWPTHLFGEAIYHLPLAFHTAVIELVFAFLFVDLFDTMGTLVGLSERVGFLDKRGRLPRANKALLSDSIGTLCGSVLGTSTVTTYIESAAGHILGRTHGLCQPGNRRPVHLHLIFYTSGAGHTVLCHSTRAHRRRRHDDGPGCSHCLGRYVGRRTRFFNTDSHSLNIQHCRWIGTRIYSLSHNQKTEQKRLRGTFFYRCIGHHIYSQICLYALKVPNTEMFA